MHLLHVFISIKASHVEYTRVIYGVLFCVREVGNNVPSSTNKLDASTLHVLLHFMYYVDYHIICKALI